MEQSVLVTGGRGFLGRAVARAFKARGCRVVGIGHGAWSSAEASAHGFDAWHEADVVGESLAALPSGFDVVAHCAANGSVGYSLQQPLAAFKQTVGSTAELLEHLRARGDTPVVVYPSSAAVYGAAEDRPLLETDPPNPVSPYGFHKLMTEELLAAYGRCFGMRVVVVRFFSIYGAGLARQLLWDAASRFASGNGTVTFFGTGEETRDWIHVDDAADLIATVASRRDAPAVLNGGSGVRLTVAEVLEMLRDALGSTSGLCFSGEIRNGDPRHYLADMSRATALGWRPSVGIAQGLADYARWFQSSCSK